MTFLRFLKFLFPKPIIPQKRYLIAIVILCYIVIEFHLKSDAYYLNQNEGMVFIQSQNDDDGMYDYPD